MALVRVRRAAQITLPAEVRQKLKVKEGDYLDAQVVGSSVVLKPVTVLERETAWEKLVEVVNRPKWRGPGREPRSGELPVPGIPGALPHRMEHQWFTRF